jgi:hypothetical protein
MKSSETKRKNLFDKFVKQLKDISSTGLLEINLPFENTYKCPICLNDFCEKDLDINLKNHLTLEDAPPLSLGGKANTLTCKKCNNESGYKIDFHLVEILNEQDLRNFLPNTSTKVNVTHKGEKVQGILNIDKDGTITISHSKKNNNPSNLDNYVENTGFGDRPNVFFQASRVDTNKVDIALLKTAYILAFEKFGYPLILNKAFDIVRQQILNPSVEIYPYGFWTKQDIFNENDVGVHFISCEHLEGFLSIFILETKANQKSAYGVYLPTSIYTYKETIERFKNLEKNSVLSLVSYKKTDYFIDLENQKLCIDFMNKRNK